MPISKQVLNKKKFVLSQNKRKIESKEIEQKTRLLDSICAKHKVTEMKFRNIKMSTNEGEMFILDSDHTCCNMRIKAMVIRTTKIEKSDGIYELVDVANKKRERDEKKILEDNKRAQEELDRQNSINDVIIDDAPQTEVSPTTIDTIHTEAATEAATETASTQENQSVDFLESLKQDDTDNIDAQIDAEIQSIIDDLPEKETQEESPTNTTPDVNISKKNKKKIQMKQEKLQRREQQARKQINEKEKSKSNRFHVRFMEDIKKFVLTPQKHIQYLEVVGIDSITPWVVTGVEVYKIEMPSHCKDTYYLCVGDLESKTGKLREIDPLYKFNSSEQMDFAEKIRAMNTKIVHKSDFSDEEDELGQLGLSDDELPELCDEDDCNNADCANEDCANADCATTTASNSTVIIEDA